MKYSRLKKAENPNNPISDSNNLGSDDWFYGRGNPLNTPQDNDGEFDPSSQPFATNDSGQNQIMLGNSNLFTNVFNQLILEPEEDLMNPVGDLDKLTLYETSTCIEGDTSDRRFEDPYSISYDGMTMLKHNPTDPLDPTVLEASDSDDYFNKQKNNHNVDMFPGITYPNDEGTGVGEGYPGYQVSPTLSYPGLV